MRKKAWILLLFATLIALLCACSDTAQQPETEKPKIRIGGTTYAPYFYRNIGGNYTGIDVEIAEEACARIGYEPIFVELDIDKGFELLNEDYVDCLWCCLTMEGNEDKFIWAGPYMYTQRVVVVPADSEIETLEDLAEKCVAVQMNQTDAGNASAAPTIRFVNSVIERAFLERASDIHLEPQEGEMVVRMRIDGILRKILTVPANLQSNVISRLKIMGGMNISERKIPQDGRAMVQVRHHEIDLRISSMPTIYGEKIVLRLLDKSGHTITKQSIGLEGTDLQKYDALLKNSSGVILIVGPTGSGKSTTMCAMLQELANEETNLMTLEDPVEYNIPGVNQCQINEKTGMTFAAGLRAILRQDPDVISVGEIRDGETGAIAIRAAITGHLVLSTLHTNDAVSAIDRLVDIGVEPYLISSALRGVISQRLVRKVCPHCKKAYRPEAEELAMLGLPEDANVQFYRGEGCQECYHTGYKGRRAVFEIFMLNGRIRRMVTEGAKYDALLRAAVETNFVTMRENCRNLVLRGEISAAEAARAINSTAD